LLSLAAAALMAFSAPSASAAETPFSCDAFGYLFQSDGVAPPNTIYQVDLASGAFTTYATEPSDLVNAVGYNTLDNYMYGWDLTTAEVARISSDGSVTHIGLPPGVGTAVSYNAGDFDRAGHYWMSSSANGAWYEIDLAPGSATYGQVLDSGTMTFPAGTAGLADWTWINGALYGVASTTSGPAALDKFDPATGQLTNLGPIAGIPGTVLVGATYTDAAGDLFASDNTSGEIYRVNVTTGKLTASAPGPASGNNDGARCSLAPIPTITVTKTVGGRAASADQFTVGLADNTGKALTSATTTGTETTAATTNWPVSQGRTYTISDAMAPGSPEPLSAYVSSIVCTDTTTGAKVTPGGSGPTWTLPVTTPDEYLCNITNRTSADLEAGKSASPATAVPGEDETYTLMVKNKGPSPASEAKVTDLLPSELSFVSADPGCTFAGGTVTCKAGTLASGASKTFKVVTKVASSVTHRIKNTAKVESPTPDPNPKNNESTTETPVGPQTDLQMTKTASATSATVGGQVMYTLVVKNNGPSDATGVTVEDTLPSGLTLVSAQPSQGSCSGTKCQLGTLAAGGSAQVLVTANVTGGGGTSVKNTAKVTGDQPDPDPGNNEDGSTVEIKPGPEPTFDLSVKKTSNVKNPTIGQQVIYTIAVKNSGPQAAPEAKVTDTLNKRVKVISVDPETGKCTTGNPFTCELGTVQPGKTVKVKAVVQVLRLGGQRNAASVMGDGKDTDPSNNMSVLKQRVNKVKLKLTKVASKANVHPGEKFSYLITVKNITKGIAKKVQVCDEMPSGLAYLSSNPKGKFGKGVLCWTIGTLGPRATDKFTVVVKALRATGTKVNRVTASGGAVAAAKAKSAVHVAPAPEKPTPVTG
jgi:uncharacterized repeat protein (TIGR01451 family)